MRRSWALAAVTVATMLLAGCLLLPGRFTSAIDLRRDGTFSFTYKGEIHVLALSKLAAEERDRKNATATFEPSTCYSDETGDERECTAEELADQCVACTSSLRAAAVRAEQRRLRVRVLATGAVDRHLMKRHGLLRRTAEEMMVARYSLRAAGNLLTAQRFQLHQHLGQLCLGDHAFCHQ